MVFCGPPSLSGVFIPPTQGSGPVGPGQGTGSSNPVSTSSLGYYRPPPRGFSGPGQGTGGGSSQTGTTGPVGSQFSPPRPSEGSYDPLPDPASSVFPVCLPTDVGAGNNGEPPVFIPVFNFINNPFKPPGGGPPGFRTLRMCQAREIPCPSAVDVVERIRRRKIDCDVIKYNDDAIRRNSSEAFMRAILPNWNPRAGYNSSFDNVCVDYEDIFFNNCLDSVFNCPTGPTEATGPTTPNGGGGGRTPPNTGTGPGPGGGAGPGVRGPTTIGPVGPTLGPGGLSGPNTGSQTFIQLPGPLGPRGGGPTTGGNRKKCKSVPVTCADYGLAPPDIPVGKRRKPAPCDTGELPINVGPGRDPLLLNIILGAMVNGQYPRSGVADNVCLEGFSDTFFAGCQDEIGNIYLTCVDPDRYQYPNTQSGDDQEPQGQDPTGSSEPGGEGGGVSIDPRQTRLNNSISNELRPNSIVTNIARQSQTILSRVQGRPSEQLNLNNEDYYRHSNYSAVSQTVALYDQVYNFFQTDPSTETRMVENNSYLTVFKNVVSTEVKYFIDNKNSNVAWNEKVFQDLTREKIIISLNESLLQAFYNLQTTLNTRIGVNGFVDIIKSHLIAGTIDEFDPEYYKFIYRQQSKQSPVVIPIVGENSQGLQTALGMFGTKSKSPYLDNYGDGEVKNNYRRTRFLLEDLEANIPTLQIDGVSAPMYLRNAGIPTSTTFDTFTNISDGAGYYFSALYDTGESLPLQTVNELSSANFLPSIERQQVLQTLGRNYNLTITVSSVSSNNEFVSSYVPSIDSSPLYFALEFSSITDSQGEQSLYNPITATYSVISEEESIRHSRNYSFNTIKINIDYRDPLIHYAKDTSTISIVNPEFNLRKFDQNRSILNNLIILRNLPAALILSPGNGSIHNPYNGNSKVTQYGDVVVRQIDVTPTFDNVMGTDRPPLEASNTTDTVGTNYFGEYEKLYDQSNQGYLFTFTSGLPIFQKSFYKDGTYSNIIFDSPSSTKSSEATLVSLVDKLTNLDGVEYLTWWDIFRRLNINQIGRLFSTQNTELINKITNSWRGVPVRYVVGRANPDYTGIPDGVEVPEDTIIIRESDRNV